MFSLVSGVYDSYFAPTQLNLLVVGASGVGKSALLERLKVTQFTKKPKPSSPSQEELEEVPDTFLPVSLRVPQTQLQSQVSSQSLKKKQEQQLKKKQDAAKKKRNFLACPAPSKYKKANDSSSDEEEDEGEDDDDEDADGVNAEKEEQPSAPLKPVRNGMGRNSSLDMSLEDVPIGESETSVNGKDKIGGPEPQDTEEDEEEDPDQEFDLKAKSRMLPLHKIRPTIGQNLGKVEMCGAQCRVWDLGGKMHDLWSRYYEDCDAVVFVWKIVDDSKPIPELSKDDDDDNDSDDEDDWPSVTASQQLSLLETVRANIPDDVPFLILGHWFPPPSLPTIRKPKAYQYDEPYSTASLLPHYHNPLMTVYFGSAKSGAGLRTAMEWLIPTATRQKKFRDKSPELAEDEEKA